MQYEIGRAWEKDTVCVPRRCAEFCAEAGEAEWKVLFFACEKRSFSEQELIAALGGETDPAALKEALAFWRGAGLFSRGKAASSVPGEKPDAPKVTVISSRPQYTAHELARAVEERQGFRSLVDFAERRLEKNFNGSDLSLLYSFVDYLGLSVEVVMLAIDTCAKEHKKSLRYIEKLLINLCDRGITEYEAADEYFTRREEYLSFEGKIRALCGFGSRALTAAEQKILTVWKDEWQVTEEEVREAYDKTVSAIAKPSVAYMNKVLNTMRSEKTGDAPAPAGKTYDTEGRFAAAVARTKKKKEEDRS